MLESSRQSERIGELVSYIKDLEETRGFKSQRICELQERIEVRTIESNRKDERIAELHEAIQALQATIREQKTPPSQADLAVSNQLLRGTVETLEERVQILLKNERIREQKMLEKEKIHEWMLQDLLSQLRQARESHEEQLAGWMEQVNALHTRIHMLERRSTVMCPSLRR
jgi:hypothetical protein